MLSVDPYRRGRHAGVHSIRSATTPERTPHGVPAWGVGEPHDVVGWVAGVTVDGVRTSARR